MMTLAILPDDEAAEVAESPPLAAVHELVYELKNLSPEALLGQILTRWPRRSALVTSFQAEGLVLLDMAWRIEPAVRVITLDTGRLPQETYDVMDRVRDRYGVEVEIFYPKARAVETLVRGVGPNAFYKSVTARLDCCRVRKVEPLQRALSGLDVWVTGLRRSQSAERQTIRKVEVDADHGGIVKLNPLADWSWQQVQDYVREHDVPEHPLYAQGYASIGCAPCTRPIEPGEATRAGRWWWEDSGRKECGLHGLYNLGSQDQSSTRPRLGGAS